MRTIIFILLLSLLLMGFTDELYAQPDVRKIEIANAFEKFKIEGLSPDQKEEAVSVYEWCAISHEISIAVDCECLVRRFLDIRSEQGPEEQKMLIIGNITREECRNISGLERKEYAKCMNGSGFKYDGRTPEEYCRCYADRWTERLRSWEGRLDQNKKSTFRSEARSMCTRDEYYK